MTEVAALGSVVLIAIFLLALGATALLAPPRAGGFLLAFASSPAKHYSELALRLVTGAAFVFAAPFVPFARWFSFFGWVLLGTTAVLLLAPWRWHHLFARRAVPEALKFLPLLGASSLLAGAFILWAVWRGNAA